jgi:hypothetical protein
MNHLFYPSSIIGAHRYAIVWLVTLTHLSNVKQGFGLDRRNTMIKVTGGYSECLLDPPFPRTEAAQGGALPLRASVQFFYGGQSIEKHSGS